MGMPSTKEARLFYRCAKLRFDEALILLKAEKLTGAVYLAGYGIECMLKALILAASPASDVTEILKLFRGGRAHDFEWLRSIYIKLGGSRFPVDIREKFVAVSHWSTELRYTARSLPEEEAVLFLNMASEILNWADRRM